MGGPVARVAAGLSTFGTSELGQKKPFQDAGSDNPIGGNSASLARFVPGAAAGAAGVDAVNAAAAKKPNVAGAPPAPTAAQTAAPSTDTAAVQAAQAEAAQRRARTVGWASTILSSVAGRGGAPSSSRGTMGS